MIVELRDGRWSYRRIAAALNAAGLPTPAGTAPWNAGHVQRLTGTVGAQQLAAALGKTLPR